MTLNACPYITAKRNEITRFIDYKALVRSRMQWAWSRHSLRFWNKILRVGDMEKTSCDQWLIWNCSSCIQFYSFNIRYWSWNKAICTEMLQLFIRLFRIRHLFSATYCNNWRQERYVVQTIQICIIKDIQVRLRIRSVS